MQLLDRELDRKIETARPAVPLEFADDVLRRIARADRTHEASRSPAIAVAVSHEMEPRARGRMTVALAAIAVVAIVLATRALAPRTAGESRESASHTPVQRDTTPRRESHVGAPSNQDPHDEIARRDRANAERDLQAKLVSEPEHATEPKMRRCTACHPIGQPASKVLVTITAFIDLDAKDADAMIRELELVSVQSAGRFAIELKLVPGSARATAAAVLAAQRQGKLWPLVERIVERADRSPAVIESHARELGLDLPQFRAAQTDPALQATIEAALREARTLRISTGFVIGNHVFKGVGAIREMQEQAVRTALEHEQAL